MASFVRARGPGSAPDVPGAPFPPLLQFLLAFLCGLAIEVASGGLGPATTVAEALGWILVAAGGALFASGMWTFARARTGILLQRPASRVVMHGPYRWTRNPMYVGCVGIYTGACLILNAGWAFLFLPVVVLLVTLTVIRREERYMARTFGAEYLEYCARVSRWI
jgi:protein-S-isoprenylcysteine O-methyltransferase Ste14